MNEQDLEEFKELCQNASDDILINMASYEIQNARHSSNEEDEEMHYLMADTAYQEMIDRGLT